MNDINYFENIETTVANALDEDIKTGDLTAGLIPENIQATANIYCREKAVICGRPWFDEVLRQVDENAHVEWLCEEGETVEKDQLICIITGSARNILTAERTALNFLQTLSGTATTTSEYVKPLQGSKTKLLDTRKTLPGLRLAQKYAVACGGGQNHRIGLYDAILLKENHIMSAGGIAEAIGIAKFQHPGKTVEVETENLEEVQEALMGGADIIMLDNFTLEMMYEAVDIVNGKAKLEVSGNVEIGDLENLAKTQVDFISTGAITKHLRSIDLSMRFKMKKA
ncbi:nicotinate-nucleotide diphosphorylase (carboxylating) [Thiomicrorhabdus immobilis]|uniref:nicotinate-nucleotide diphosphorylase (carboxylating) n=1 Tax=Thiomicrorhabdus immobilis TaxID=2791037 RepID=A0ABN6CXX6_9GAMM|nr:carboxylating nicotinate-nucleotide diphosphorylase [Thiomicrorhabdus immobilis]BCN93539.1 nicotinate-nucleotide diphosphorylase (carboxylating) [Thiomicrorhabdus immobilis]